ncbi:phosphoribosylaminoimidazolesuccinocarboxamide synthase [Chloroflexota bacterium]
MSENKQVILTTDLPLPVFSQGKVRDTYDLDDRLLIVATDRISAFDFVLPSGIPDKGLVLNQLSSFWFRQTANLLSNHIVEVIDNVSRLDTHLPAGSRFPYPAYLAGRTVIVKKAKRIPVECVVRGYISGSAWKEYQQYGTVSGMPLPEGLQQSQELPMILFTPTTKADEGHDEPMSMDEVGRLIGADLADEIREKTLAIYGYARRYAADKGIIIADTKMEFGLVDGKLILIDELLTPDSSRLWDTALYTIGQEQPSYDKQPVRDWLAGSGWDQQSAVPALPPEVIASTTERYKTAYSRITGREL